MSRIQKKALWADGDVLTPHEINAELTALLGEFNGNLDRDNFGGDILTSDKFAIGTFNQISTITGTGTPETQVLGKASRQGRPKLRPIPSNANGWSQMSVNMQTTDGALQIETSINWQHKYILGDGSTSKYYNDTSTRNYTKHAGQVMICIVVDGNVVARSGVQTEFIQQCRYLNAYVPVGAGTHTVAVMAYIFTGRDSKVTSHTGALTDSMGVTVEWLGRNLWVRHVKR